MDKHVCGECAKGKLECTNCCVSPFIEKDPGFWLTLSDIGRIVKKTGLKPDDFCRLTEVEDDGEDDGDVDEKAGDLLYIGDRVILMNGNNGGCFFLGEKGCKIFDVRPRMCRIYPFWFEEKDGDIKITVEHEDDIKEDDCYLTKKNHKNGDINLLLKEMGETEEEMKRCIKSYIEEMKLHSRFKHELEEKSILEVLEKNGFLN